MCLDESGSVRWTGARNLDNLTCGIGDSIAVPSASRVYTGLYSELGDEC